jgi:membrane protein implicated in regulation of membrane protease activity
MGFLNPELYWLIIGVMLLIMELALPAFVMFFFGLGALVTSLVVWLVPMAIAWQLGLFIIASLVSLVLLRDMMRKMLFRPKKGEEEDRDEVWAVPGDRGVVSKTIAPPAEGRIKYGGSFWRATADEYIAEGEIIVVVKQVGLVIHVEKV